MTTWGPRDSWFAGSQCALVTALSETPSWLVGVPGSVAFQGPKRVGYVLETPRSRRAVPVSWSFQFRFEVSKTGSQTATDGQSPGAMENG
jgi:hypothetical protein